MTAISRSRVALPMATHLARTMPWDVLLAGCGTSTAAVVILDATSRYPLSANDVRLTLLPAIAALCFVPHIYFRPVIQTVPVPTWLTAAGHVLFAAPLLAATCAADLQIMSARYAANSRTPALYPLVAQLAGWAAIALLTATWCDRTRFASLTGAIATPVTLALITLAWTEPHLTHILTTPEAHPHTAAAGWATVAVAALIGAAAASRDTWHRYAHIMRPLTPRGRGATQRG